MQFQVLSMALTLVSLSQAECQNAQQSDSRIPRKRKDLIEKLVLVVARPDALLTERVKHTVRKAAA